MTALRSRSSLLYSGPLLMHAQATALAICAHTSPPCGPCAREIKNAPFHTWGYEGRPWTSNDCAQASHTEKNARAHDFSQNAAMPTIGHGRP